MRAKILGLLAVGLSGIASVSNGATVDFNSVTPDTYASLFDQGVTFTAVTGDIDAVVGQNGTVGIIGSLASPPLSELRADISGGAGYVAVDLGDLGGDEDLLFLEAFSSSNILLGSTTLTLAKDVSGMRTLSLARADIAYAIFGSRSPSENGSSVYADNFTWSVAAPVPLPAAAWLLLSGLAGLGWMGRRKANCSSVA